MLRAGGQVPTHTVPPASARALAIAKPYPPSSATPATRARLPRRSMPSIGCPFCGTRDARCGMRGARNRRIPHPVSRIPSQEKPRRHRNQLWMSDQRMREDAAERAFLLGDAVGRARQRVEEPVVHVLERPLESVVLDVV